MSATWVFLRGLARDSRHWGDFPAEFRAEFADADIVALDLPGNGVLCRLQSPARIEDMVDAYRQQLQARGIRPPYRLLALSLGAMAAVAWSVRHAEEIAGGVLISTSLRPISPFFRRLRPARYPALLALPFCPAHAAERAILRLTSARATARADVLEAWTAWRRASPVSARNALRQLAAAARFRAPLASPPPPLLLLAGANDALVHPGCSRDIARRWQTPFVEHPSAGHDLPLDDGPWVAAQVRSWLDAGEP